METDAPEHMVPKLTGYNKSILLITGRVHSFVFMIDEHKKSRSVCKTSECRKVTYQMSLTFNSAVVCTEYIPRCEIGEHN